MHIHVNDVYIYMHIIHISYLIYIYATVPWIYEKHNIPLINSVVALYAILPL